MRNSPRNVVVDTGLMVALFDANDPSHEQSKAFVHTTTATLHSTIAVVTEAMYLLDFSLRGQTSLLRWIAGGGVTLQPAQPDDLDRVARLMDKYADLPMDFADGLLVALCERLDLPHIATFDSDFDIYRLNGRKRFVNVIA